MATMILGVMTFDQLRQGKASLKTQCTVSSKRVSEAVETRTTITAPTSQNDSQGITSLEKENITMVVVTQGLQTAVRHVAHACA